MTMKYLAIAAGIVACIAMCFASATASPFCGKESAAEFDARLQKIQFTQSAASQATDVDFRAKGQSAGGKGRAANSKLVNCASDFNENCTPSAQLASTGLQWSSINTNTEKYNTNWICKVKDSFVSCGMNFIYEDQKLYVPVCGIYKIYSQILFQSYSSISAVVHHRVEVKRNCINSGDNTAEFGSYVALVPVSVSRATTINLAMVKMCAGGSVSVVIPSESACCAFGDKKSTYFSVQLISQVDCDNI